MQGDDPYESNLESTILVCGHRAPQHARSLFGDAEFTALRPTSVGFGIPSSPRNLLIEHIDCLPEEHVGGLCLLLDRANRQLRGPGRAIVICTTHDRNSIEHRLLRRFWHLVTTSTPIARLKSSETNASEPVLFGVEKLLQDVGDTILRPMQDERLAEMGISPIRGVLLFGQPGSGKSTLAQYIASEMRRPTITVNCAGIREKYVGSSERNLARCFEDARRKSPSVLILEQIDIISSSRNQDSDSRLVTVLLTELDGVYSRNGAFRSEADVFVIGVTDRREVMDSAALRPGRLDVHIHVPLPNEEERYLQLVGFGENIPNAVSQTLLRRIAREANDWSPADLKNLWRRAGLFAIQESEENRQIDDHHVCSVFQACQ